MAIPTSFNRDTTGVEVVKAFADQVEGKTWELRYLPLSFQSYLR